MGLSPPRDRDTKEKSDEQAGKRRLARDCCNGRESPAGLSSFLNCRGETVDSCVEASGDFADSSGYVRRHVDGALGHAGLGRGLRYLRAQARDLQA